MPQRQTKGIRDLQERLPQHRCHDRQHQAPGPGTPARARHGIMRDRSGKTVLNACIRLRNALIDVAREGLVEPNVCDRCDPPRISANPTVILEAAQPAALNEPAGRAPGERSVRFRHRHAVGRTVRGHILGAVVSNGVHGIMVMHELQRYDAGTVISSWLHAARVRGEVWMVPPKSHKGIRLSPSRRAS